MTQVHAKHCAVLFVQANSRQFNQDLQRLSPLHFLILTLLPSCSSVWQAIESVTSSFEFWLINHQSFSADLNCKDTCDQNLALQTCFLVFGNSGPSKDHQSFPF